MGEFISISKANESDDLEIDNHSFFVPINIKDVREVQRLDGTVTTERLKNAIITAIISVNNDLYEWRLEKQSAGFSSIKDLSDEQIGGESRYSHLYKQAVYCTANALLNDQYLNFDVTGKAKKEVEPEQESAGNLYRNARYAIRDILGKSRSTMELI